MGAGESGVFISATALALISPIALAAVGAIGVLYRAVLEAKNQQIAREVQISDRSLAGFEELTPVVKRAVELVERIRGPV